MKQKYTLTVADAEINVITDEPREAIDTIVGVVDRRIRELHLKSRNCSRTEAALLLCLDYCAEKLKLQKKIKMADAEITRLVALNDAAARENAALVREVEALRQTLNMKTITPPAPTKISRPVQLSINEDMRDEEKYSPFTEEKVADEAQAEIIARDEVLSSDNNFESETLTPPADEPVAPVAEEPKQKEPPKKKRVRSMFDLITFDKL